MFKILKILFGLLLIFVLYRYGRIDPSLIDFSYNSIVIYFYAILLISATIFLSAIRLYLVLNVLSLKIEFKYIFKLTYIGHFFNHCLPGATGGDLIKIIYLIKRYKFFNKAALISYIIIDRIFGLIALFLLFLLSLYALSDFNENLLNLFNFFVMTSLAGLVMFFIFLYFNFFKLLHNKINNYKNSFANFFNEYFENLKNLKNFNIYNISKILLVSIIIFTLAISAIILLGGENYFNINGFFTMFFTSCVTFFANSIPISFNGLGIGEYVFSQLSTVFYNDKALIFGNIFLTYRILLIFSSLPGLLAFITLKNKLK